MPTGQRKIPSKPMKKWCRTCEEFKPNPKNKKNPMYCEDCIQAIYIKALMKRNKTMSLRKDKQKTQSL